MNVKKTVGNVAEFIDKAEAAPKKLRYTSESGATHMIYIPTKKTTEIIDGVEKEVEGIVAISVPIHNVTTIDGHYRGTYCNNHSTDENNKEVICPYCANIPKAWDEVNYLIEREKETCGITNEAEREKHMETKRKEILRKLKLSRPTTNVYMLVAQYELDKKGKPVLDDETKLPVFEMKVMRISMSRLKSLQTTAEMVGYEDIGGVEFKFKYDTAEARFRKCNDAAMAAEASLVVKYAGLLDAINKEVDKFDMNELPNAFSELRDVPEEEKQKIIDDLFASWDKYLLESAKDPNAVYLESKSANPVAVEAESEVPDLRVDTDELFKTTPTL